MDEFDNGVPEAGSPTADTGVLEAPPDGSTLQNQGTEQPPNQAAQGNISGEESYGDRASARIRQVIAERNAKEQALAEVQQFLQQDPVISQRLTELNSGQQQSVAQPEMLNDPMKFADFVADKAVHKFQETLTQREQAQAFQEYAKNDLTSFLQANPDLANNRQQVEEIAMLADTLPTNLPSRMEAARRILHFGQAQTTAQQQGANQVVNKIQSLSQQPGMQNLPSQDVAASYTEETLANMHPDDFMKLPDSITDKAF